MAIFLAKGIAGTAALVPTSGLVGAQAYNCVSGGVSLFTDVLPTDIYCKHVHYIAAQNVTLGCSTAKYCPGDNVTRIQMAAFIAKAIVAPGGGAAIPLTYGPDPVTGLSYSCDAGSPERALHRRARHRSLLQARPLPLGQGHRLGLRGDDLLPDGPSSRAMPWRSSWATRSRFSSTDPSRGSVLIC